MALNIKLNEIHIFNNMFRSKTHTHSKKKLYDAVNIFIFVGSTIKTKRGAPRAFNAVRRGEISSFIIEFPIWNPRRKEFRALPKNFN